MRTFSVPVEHIDIEEINNGDFLKLKLCMISDGVNRNNSEFLKESFEEGIKTIRNKPILAYYNKKLGDVEEHNSRISVDENLDIFYDYQYEGGEKPVGVIPESADIRIEEKGGKNWIVVDGAIIWTEYNRQLVDLLKRQGQKKVSVEVDFLDWFEDNGVTKVKSWKFLGVTILGKLKDGTLVEEGIEGAHLKLADYIESEGFKKFVARMEFAMRGDKIGILSKYGLAEKGEFLSKTEWGTGEDITIDKSKDAVSDKPWGEVDKTELRNKVLKAGNYKSLVKAVYLLVDDGWEDSPSSKLKYPVMEIKDGKAVYNKYGLLSAQQYGEKNDKEIASKAKALRKKLGLLEEEKRDNMNKFISLAKENGLCFVGACEDKLLFVKEAEEGFECKDTMNLLSVDKCKAEEFEADEEKEFAVEELCDMTVKLFDDDEDEEEEDGEDKDESEEEDKKDEDEEEEDAEKEEMKAELESCKSELASCKEELAKCQADFQAKCDELKTLKMSNLKNEAMAIMADESFVDADCKKELESMLDECKFECIDDFIRELSYRKYQKELSGKNFNKFTTFGKKVNPTKSVSKTDGLDMI